MSSKKTTDEATDAPSVTAPEMSAEVSAWWNGLTQRERELWLKQHMLHLLSGRLRDAIAVATAYLDDGAPLSAQKALKEACR